MLSKKNRLTSREFKTFFSEGKKHHTPLFTVVYVPYDTFHTSVVVPKKVAKRAVDRNKMRRRVYGAVQQSTTQKNTTGVFIFLMKKEAFEVEYAVLKEAVSKLLNNITD